MPVDEQGIRAELLVSPASTIHRENTGQLDEQIVNRCSEFVKRKVIETAKTDINNASLIALDYINDINPNYAELIKTLLITNDDRKEFVNEIINDRIYLNIPPFLNIMFSRGGKSSLT